MEKPVNLTNKKIFLDLNEFIFIEGNKNYLPKLKGDYLYSDLKFFSMGDISTIRKTLFIRMNRDGSRDLSLFNSAFDSYNKEKEIYIYKVINKPKILFKAKTRINLKSDSKDKYDAIMLVKTKGIFISNYKLFTEWVNNSPVQAFETNNKIINNQFYKLEYHFSQFSNKTSIDQFLFWINTSPFKPYIYTIDNLNKKIDDSNKRLIFLTNELIMEYINEFNSIICFFIIPNDGLYRKTK